MEENALEVASLAGHILLENGAEIARVEETMERIASHYGEESENFFVLSNGIFTTGESGYAKVEFIPFKGAQLERVVEVNQISRDIACDRYTLAEARQKLLEVRSNPAKPKLEQIIGSAVGSAGFCMIFGGGLLDAAAAFVVGALLWTFVVFVSVPYLSKILGNIAGGVVASLLCLLFHKVGFGSSLGNMIVGSLIPLIPGVAFTNGIRDLADEDYIAGATRLLDALMVFFCIAAGVVITFTYMEKEPHLFDIPSRNIGPFINGQSCYFLALSNMAKPSLVGVNREVFFFLNNIVQRFTELPILGEHIG